MIENLIVGPTKGTVDLVGDHDDRWKMPGSARVTIRISGSAGVTIK